MPFFTLNRFRQHSDIVTSVQQTLNSVKSSGIGKISEIRKFSFDVDNFHVYHGAVEYPFQGSISILYGNKPVRPSVLPQTRSL
jgi:hypothetical protein